MNVVESTRVKETLRILAEQAVRKVAESNLALDYFRQATAYYDTRRDEFVSDLSSLENATLILEPVLQGSLRTREPPEYEPDHRHLD